ncbi:unnamed protein product [Adineta ricciae]|nr:unnamed protein product [Adineta ricciae]
MIYNTDLNGLTEKYDCLIIDDHNLAIGKNEYCRRPLESLINRNADECDEAAIYFSTLRKHNRTSSYMIKYGAPVDTIDAYQIYLETGREDGQIDCDNGIDEQYCLALELNQCNAQTEYRCRQGFCISRQAAFDMVRDCLDASDEHRFDKYNMVLTTDVFCEDHEFLFCHEHFCGKNMFACGDGTCSSNLWDRLSCSTKRDLQFIRHILSTSMTDKDSCWTYAICHLKFLDVFPHITSSICQRSKCEKDMFFFPAEHPIVYPNVQLLYKTKRIFSSDNVQPDYICFDALKCQYHNWSMITLFNRTCSPWNNFNKIMFSKDSWHMMIFSIQQIFISCTIPSIESKNDDRLFECGQSFFISKHRLNDGYVDCYMGIDEYQERDTCALNLANRFQCQTDKTQCIPRLFLSDGIEDCMDGSDENSLYPCSSYPVEAGCKWKRGSLNITVNFRFLQLCDGFISIKIDNMTDESNCLSTWIDQCNSSWTRCDGYWHCRDGRDELNCPPIPQYPCKNKEEFYCMNRTTRTFVCYPSHLAGDGHEDCVGAIDERVGGYCHQTNPMNKTKRFRCGNSSVCLHHQQLCNGIRNCPIDNYEDEGALCPWLENTLTTENQNPYFLCPNQSKLAFRCNQIRECANGEDEFYCNIDEPDFIRGMLYLEQYLSSIIVYPPQIPTSLLSSKHVKTDIVSIHAKIARMHHTQLTSNKNLVHATWFCNRGLLGYKNNKEICFCPFYSYGDRCEFQRRRVTITARVETNDFYSDNFVSLKLVFYLINRENFHIVDYTQTIIIPRKMRMNSRPYDYSSLFIYLLFPTHRYKEFREAAHFVKIDAFILNNQSLDFQASWYYILPFKFLPVQRLSVQLILVNTVFRSLGTCIHGTRMPYMNSEQTWCHCEPGWIGTECRYRDTVCHPNPCFAGSICISVREQYVCLCPSNRFGPTCRIETTHICHSDICHNNGSCLTLDVNGRIGERRFYCLCPLGFTGLKCEKKAARFNIRFESELINKYLHAPAIIFRLSRVGHLAQLEDSYKYMIKNVQLAKSLPTFYRDPKVHHFDFAFVQLFISAHDIFGKYYLIASNNTLSSGKEEHLLAMDINSTVLAQNYCPYIDQLFNTTILRLVSLQRAKYYQQPCQNHSQLMCFHDESFICVCDRYHITKCFNYAHRSMNCSSSHSCLNGGLCLQQDEIRNPLDYLCICEECFFGERCQFTTSQYTISLDALVGSLILVDTPFPQQPFLIQMIFFIISALFCIGFCLNTLTTALFICQKDCQSTGCGFYIIASSVLGIGCLGVLMLKCIALILLPELSSGMSCILIEYFLKYLPTVVDWTHTCVLLERVSTIRKGASFNKETSKNIAKIVIPSLILLIGISLMHDPFHRQSIIDPRLTQGRRPWCMVEFSTSISKFYNMIINMSHYFIPFIINLICAVIIILYVSRMKSKIKSQTYSKVLKKQILACKHLIISPIVLIILALPRLTFATIFTCISNSTPWRIYLLLVSHLLSFFPQIGTLFIFVLPSTDYTNELRIFTKKLRLNKSAWIYFSDLYRLKRHIK